MARSKAKSMQIFEMGLWSVNYYKGKRNYNQDNIYNGIVMNKKTGKKKHFHSPAELLEIIEDFYSKGEKRC